MSTATAPSAGSTRATRPEWHTPKGQRRREQLLRAAITVIAEHGYAGATQRAIAAEAGVPPASTHYFFDSVEDLIRQATAWYLQERLAFYEEQINAFAATDRSPEAGCKLVAELLSEISVENRTAQFEVYLNARRQPEVQSAVIDAIERLEALCARLIETMGVPDPTRWAAGFLAIGDGFALRAVASEPVAQEVLERSFLAIVLANRVVPAGAR
jgi:DNA-binding transcriptional regulator YbjK